MPASGGKLRAFAADLRGKPWRLAAALLLLALFATNIYRAATQSIAHDEGVLFEWFLPGGMTQALSVQHGNHHVLHDLLCKISVTLFGPAQFPLRIPALLGGLLYFLAVFAIAGLLFGEGPLSLLAVAFLCLNPFVLDYLSCARGYSMALGFFMASLYCLVRFLAEPAEAAGRGRLVHFAGVALGLAVGSNVIMIFPAGALTAAFLAMLLAESLIRKPEEPSASRKERPAAAKKERRARRARHAASAPHAGGVGFGLLHFAIPAVLIGGFFSALPQRLIELEEGYLGPPSLLAILQPLVRFSLFHSPYGFPGLALAIPAETLARAITAFVVPAGLVALAALAIAIAARWASVRSFDALPRIDRFLLLLAAALPLTVVLIVISRYAFHQPYPEMRTVMYWLPLLSLGALAGVQKLAAGGSPARYGAAALAGILALGTVQFATQFNTRYFAEWFYCAAGRDMMKIIRDEHARGGARRVRLGVTWQLEPVVNFYRVAWGMDWTDPVTREGADGPFDYYLLAFGDRALIEQRGLRPLLRDELSQTALARRSDF